MAKQKEKKPEFDAQAAFLEALKSGTQYVTVKRGDDKHFPYLSTWEHEGRKYQVYTLLNAGNSVKIGFMPVRS